MTEASADVREQRLPELVDREYWLRHCDGFRVDSSSGRVGFVQEVRSARDSADTATLAVRAGMLGRTLLLISADEVGRIAPRARRVWLRSTPTISGTETLSH